LVPLIHHVTKAAFPGRRDWPASGPRIDGKIPAYSRHSRLGAVLESLGHVNPRTTACYVNVVDVAKRIRRCSFQRRWDEDGGAL
jgi:hypothetical protein